MATTETGLCNVALLRVGHRDALTDYATDSTPAARACRILYPQARDATLAAFPWRFAAVSAALAVDVDLALTDWGHVYHLPANFLAARRLWNGTRDPGEAEDAAFELWGPVTLAKSVAIGGLVRVATTVTAETETAHNLAIGDTVTLSPGEADFAAGTKTVLTVPDETSFTYTEAGSATASTVAQTFTRTVSRILVADYEDATLLYTRSVTDVSAMPILFQEAVAWRLAMELALALPVKPQLAPMFEAKFRETFGKAVAIDFAQSAAGVGPDSEFARVRL